MPSEQKIRFWLGFHDTVWVYMKCISETHTEEVSGVLCCNFLAYLVQRIHYTICLIFWGTFEESVCYLFYSLPFSDEFLMTAICVFFQYVPYVENT